MYRQLSITTVTTLRKTSAQAPFLPLSAGRCFGDSVRKAAANKDFKIDQYPDDKHATSKVKQGDTYNFQESNAKKGLESKDVSGNAIEGRDSTSSVKKTKQEHPEAPDPVIGMQDERGARGA